MSSRRSNALVARSIAVGVVWPWWWRGLRPALQILQPLIRYLRSVFRLTFAEVRLPASSLLSWPTVVLALSPVTGKWVYIEFGDHALAPTNFAAQRAISTPTSAGDSEEKSRPKPDDRPAIDRESVTCYYYGDTTVLKPDSTLIGMPCESFDQSLCSPIHTYQARCGFHPRNCTPSNPCSRKEIASL